MNEAIKIKAFEKLSNKMDDIRRNGHIFEKDETEILLEKLYTRLETMANNICKPYEI
jgi:hypothetical protein